eukprot:6172927-Pleurochrysis_carterae.AAC.3
MLTPSIEANGHKTTKLSFASMPLTPVRICRQARAAILGGRDGPAALLSERVHFSGEVASGYVDADLAASLPPSLLKPSPLPLSPLDPSLNPAFRL